MALTRQPGTAARFDSPFALCRSIRFLRIILFRLIFLIGFNQRRHRRQRFVRAGLCFGYTSLAAQKDRLILDRDLDRRSHRTEPVLRLNGAELLRFGQLCDLPALVWPDSLGWLLLVFCHPGSSFMPGHALHSLLRRWLLSLARSTAQSNRQCN